MVRLMDLVDSVDRETSYGILCCKNETITESNIQSKIFEIKQQLEQEGTEWYVADIIARIPNDWEVDLHEGARQLQI